MFFGKKKKEGGFLNNEMFGEDVTYTEIKCIGFYDWNMEKPIQFSIRNTPYGIGVVKNLTIDEARHFVKIIEQEIAHSLSTSVEG